MVWCLGKSNFALIWVILSRDAKCVIPKWSLRECRVFHQTQPELIAGFDPSIGYRAHTKVLSDMLFVFRSHNRMVYFVTRKKRCQQPIVTPKDTPESGQAQIVGLLLMWQSICYPVIITCVSYPSKKLHCIICLSACFVCGVIQTCSETAKLQFQ
jgi:hypothetical protein